ncbi:MAG: TonB-dependent receptor [Acidobacteriales bacterium]|nr:TonB-dependent receptor [Terriglobales bacterium]
MVDQQRGFREYYVKGDVAGHSGGHDWKVGADGVFSNVNEKLHYVVTDLQQFDPGTAAHFAFSGTGYERDQALFAQDEVHLGTWNVAGRLRFDHYKLELDETAWSPRIGISKYFDAAGVLVHASYDRIFETPAIENLLLASSPQVQAVGDSILRFPVAPARANFYEIGASKAFAAVLSLDVNVYKRQFKNFPDDDVLLDTGVSFPIALAHATVRGAEAKLQLRSFHRTSGFLSYTNQSGTAQGPITGGLLLGSEAVAPISAADSFSISQDQRNTATARANYQVNKRFWAGAGATYASGLPTDLSASDVNYASLLAQYGPQVVGKVNFARGRVRPSFALNFSAGWQLYVRENKSVSVQAQVANVLDRVNVINFEGLFSGTAIAPGRGVSVQIRSAF